MKTEIIATKIAEGKVVTHINGSGQDVMEMLTMLQRSIALTIMENGSPPDVAEVLLYKTMKAGLEMAIRDRGGK